MTDPISPATDPINHFNQDEDVVFGVGIWDVLLLLDDLLWHHVHLTHGSSLSLSLRPHGAYPAPSVSVLPDFPELDDIDIFQFETDDYIEF